MFKSDWLFGCCTMVKVTVEFKWRRIKWLQMNLEGQGHGFLTPSRNFLVLEPNSSYAFNSYWCSEPHKINCYQCHSVKVQNHNYMLWYSHNCEGIWMLPILSRKIKLLLLSTNFLKIPMKYLLPLNKSSTIDMLQINNVFLIWFLVISVNPSTWV